VSEIFVPKIIKILQLVFKLQSKMLGMLFWDPVYYSEQKQSARKSVSQHHDWQWHPQEKNDFNQTVLWWIGYPSSLPSVPKPSQACHTSELLSRRLCSHLRTYNSGHKIVTLLYKNTIYNTSKISAETYMKCR